MAGAERGAHGQLAFAAHRARQDQVGDVRAGDDEHDGGRGEQHEEDRSRRRGDLIAQPRDAQLTRWPSSNRPRGARASMAAWTAASSARAASSEAPGARRPKSSVIRWLRLVTIVAPR